MADDVDLSQFMEGVDLSKFTDQQKARVRAALKARDPRKRTMLDTPSGRMLNAMFLGAPSLADAAAKAAITEAQRRIPGGVEPKYTAADRFEAERAASAARRAAFEGKHPVTAFATDVGGSVMMPGGRLLGKWVVGSKAPAAVAAGKKITAAVRAGQAARGAAVAGATTGVQAGALAPPGQVRERAQTGALTGAIMAPVADVAARGATAAAPVVARNLKRAVGRGPTPEVTAIEKVQRSLRDAGVTPDVIAQVRAEWSEMGGVTPATLDLIRDAGASPEVMRLLGRSTARVPQRQAAEAYAEETIGGTQKAALEQAQALPTGGETRTPALVRADLDAQRASVESALETDRARIAAEQAAGTRAPPSAPRERESGTAMFADELNRLYDDSYQTYKAAYEAAESAPPEAAVVEDTAVRPLFDKLKTPQNFEMALPGVAEVTRYINTKKNLIAPGDAADWPEDEVMELAAPLSVLELNKMRQALTHYASKYADEPGGALAARFKQTLDDEMARLSAEDRIVGDPAVVETWRTAIDSFAEHQRKFGSGLPAKLTARRPTGEREVEGFRAGEIIFGASPSQASLNKTLSELEGSLDFMSPEAVRALQEELYGRVKVEDLPKLRETTGGRRLLPEDLAEEAEAARLATQSAEEAAQRATLEAEARAAAQVEGLERGPQAALELGETALTRPTEEFEPAIRDVQAVDEPLVAVGAKQAVIDALERSRRESTAPLNRMLNVQAERNLSQAVGPDAVARMQRRMRAIERRGQGAQELQRAVGVSSLRTDPLIETISSGEAAYRSGQAHLLLRLLRSGRYLNEKEYDAALKVLTSKDPKAADRLLQGLVKKYPAARQMFSPALTRPLANQGDPEAVETLEEEYGLID